MTTRHGAPHHRRRHHHTHLSRYTRYLPQRNGPDVVGCLVSRLKLAHFAAVENSEKARALLRDERLQEVIRQIDGQGSDAAREAALQERCARRLHPLFLADLGADVRRMLLTGWRTTRHS